MSFLSNTRPLALRLAAVWSRVQLAGKLVTAWIVRASIRFSPTEAQRTFGVTLLAGAACGVIAVVFHLAIQTADAALIQRAQRARGWFWIALTLGLPTVGGLVAGLALHYGFPAARGSGVPQVKAAYAGNVGRVRLRDGFAKFFITVLQLGSGASLGREGPTVQICAAASSALGRLFALSPRSVRRMLPVGAAAGVAAAFNAPIAAVTFTVEEIVGGLDQTVLAGVVVAAALAAVIEHTILGENPVLNVVGDPGLTDASALLFYAVLGLAAGVVSVAFCRALLRLRTWFKHCGAPPWATPAMGGLMTGVCAVSGLALVQSEGIAGGGYVQLTQTLNGVLPLRTLLVLGILKFVATLFSYSSGGAGGLFAPALFIGAMLGGGIGWLDHWALGHADTGAFALVGMGAAFAGIIRAPITSVLIIFEMTGGYGLVLPLMIANTTAYVVSRKLDVRGLYDSLLEQDGVHLLHRPAVEARLQGLLVGDAMTTAVHSLGANLTVQQALSECNRDSYGVYPLVDASDSCLGMITRARIQRVHAEGRGDTAIATTYA